MICQISQLCKRFEEKIWEIPLEECYQGYVKAVQGRSMPIIIAENGQTIQPTEYILYGTYERSTIFDVQKVESGDGKWHWNEVEAEGFRIQRIQIRETKETHGVLVDILVPYEQYSVRYILYHLLRFFRRKTTIEKYCAGKRFDQDLFSEWLRWMKDHITVLCNMGLTKNADENRDMLYRWGKNMALKLQAWLAKSLRLLKQGLFQRHKMPNRPMSQSKSHPG